MRIPVAEPSQTGTARTSERTSRKCGSTVLTTGGKSLQLPALLLPSVEIVNGHSFVLSASFSDACSCSFFHECCPLALTTLKLLCHLRAFAHNLSGFRKPIQRRHRQIELSNQVHKHLSHLIYPSTARVVGAPRIISQPMSSSTNL